jgi:hypothetical protein
MYCSLVVVLLLFRFCSAFFVVVPVANSPCAPAVIVGVLCLYCRFALIYPRFFAVTTTGHTSIGNIFMGQYFFRNTCANNAHNTGAQTPKTVSLQQILCHHKLQFFVLAQGAAGPYINVVCFGMKGKDGTCLAHGRGT